MLYTETKYMDDGDIYYIDIDALREEIDKKRGEDGVEKYVNSLPDKPDLPKGRTVIDWINGRHDPRDIKQVKCLLDALSVEYTNVMIPERLALNPEYENRKIIERELQLNDLRKKMGIDIFFIPNYFYFFGNSANRINVINMKRVFDGKLVTSNEFLDTVEELLIQYSSEPRDLKEFKTKHRWCNSEDRLIRNKYNSIFSGYDVAARILRYKYGFNINRWQLCGVIKGIYCPTKELIEALSQIIDEAKKNVIVNEYGEDFVERPYSKPLEDEAVGNWYVPVMLGNDSLLSRFMKIGKMKKYCKLSNKKMLSSYVRESSITKMYDIKKAVDLAKDTHSTVLVYANWDFIDDEYKRLLCNYSKDHNVPVKYMFKNNRIA